MTRGASSQRGRWCVASSTAPPAQLPDIRELVLDPGRSGRALARDGLGQIWEQNGAEPFRTAPPSLSIASSKDILAAYRRGTLERASGGGWPVTRYPLNAIEYPKGALRMQVADSLGRAAMLGRTPKDGGLPLFSGERFSFDDVRDAVIVGDAVFAATPLGISRYAISSWDNGTGRLDLIEFASGTGPSSSDNRLDGFDRIVTMRNGITVAWNNRGTFQLEPGGKQPAFW